MGSARRDDYDVALLDVLRYPIAHDHAAAGRPIQDIGNIAAGRRFIAVEDSTAGDKVPEPEAM